MRRLPLLALLCLFVLPAFAAPDLPKLVQLIDYVGVDYRGAVAAGAVVNEAEYAEMRDFTRAIEEQARQLPAHAANDGIRAQARQLAQLVEQRAAPDHVAGVATELRHALVGAFDIVVVPRKAPDLQRARQLFTENCVACHGAEGRGDGIQARGMEPPPTDFTDAERYGQRTLYGLYSTLSNGVDDTAMRISHALRGEEWISSAPKHLQLYEAMGYTPTQFAHLPLILGPDGKKLSKRSGDTALLDYRDNGYLAEAMVNFLATLGWSLDDRTSILGRTELLRSFSLERVVPNPAVFDLQRLDFLNGHYIREMPPEQWVEVVTQWCERGLPPSIPRPVDREVVAQAAPLLQERVQKLAEVPAMVEFLFGFEAPQYAAELIAERVGGDRGEAVRILDGALVALDQLGEAEWARESVESAIRGLEGDLGLKLRKFVPVLYVAEMGRPAGIPLFDSMALLGRERSLARLRTARLRLG